MNKAAYVNNLVEQYQLEEARPVQTPCNNQFKLLRKNSGKQPNTSNPYFALVGALLWLSNGTRPDIMFAVNRLSSFMNDPTEEHWKAAVCVLVYALDTSTFSITLSGSGKTLTAHSDSDWAEQVEARRSTTGFIFFNRSSPVSWKSKRQPTIALSSTEAEYMALTDAPREALWWRTVLQDLDFLDTATPTTFHYNNKGAGDLARNPCRHARSKHIDVTHHFIRECLASNKIALTQVSTHNMLADILTKPLKQIKH